MNYSRRISAMLRRYGTMVPATALLLAVVSIGGCGGGAGGYTNTGPPPTYTVGGGISGLAASGLVLTNGTDTASPVSGATSFTFGTQHGSGVAYTVTVKTQPANQTCSVSNGSGTIASMNVTSVQVACAGSLWTWLSGSKTPNALGMYGMLGMSAAGNTPGARAGSASWTDGLGRLWMFGGYGNDSAAAANPATSYLSDLWRFDPLLSQWTWMGGSSTANTAGTYGTKGMPSTSNSPGGRKNTASWTDLGGALWLFGGSEGGAVAGSTSYFNDLWKYNPSDGSWTWVSGANTVDVSGTYGTLHMAGAADTPGAREGASTWVDSTGNLWMFGGYGVDSASANADLNDLWKFDPVAKQWSWEGGSMVGQQPGVYSAVPGVAAPTNQPGSRRFAAAWTSNGKFWMFGGVGYPKAPGAVATLNDLWQYDPVAVQWIWSSGADTGGAVGVYGTQGMSAPANVPGARDQSVGWQGSPGIFWLFGGNSNGSLVLGASGAALNDLWKYDVGHNNWTWVSGSGANPPTNEPGNYGSQGVASATNVPGARQSASAWIDANATLWLFGGYGYDPGPPPDLRILNDLWFILPQ